MSDIRIFVSYSREDSLWIQEGSHGLIPWLARALKRDGVEVWCDPELRNDPGADFKQRIRQEIERAHVAVLLVSQDFVNSEFIGQYELPWVRERLEEGAQTVIPILVGPVARGELGWISERQMLPSKMDPLIDVIESVSRWKHAQVEILSAVRQHIQTIRKARQSPSKNAGVSPTATDRSRNLMKKAGPNSDETQAPASAQRERHFFVRTICEHPCLPLQDEQECRFQVELLVNPQKPDEQSLPSHLCLVLDLSGSMSRQNKYGLLRQALRSLLANADREIYVSVVAFSEGAKPIVFARKCGNLDPDALLAALDGSQVKFGGLTQLGAGLKKAAELCRKFSDHYSKNISRVYVMTDGRVHDPKVCAAAPRWFIKQDTEVHAFGFGEDYDPKILRGVTHGCAGGTVKSFKDLDGIITAFGRAAVSTSNVVATNTVIRFQAAPSVLLNEVYLFRPRELDVSNYISSDSTSCELAGLWPNFESRRIYSVLLKTRIPAGTGNRTAIGTVIVDAVVGGVPVCEESPVTVGRSEDAAPCSRINANVSKAFDSCEFRNSRDPQLILKHLHACRDLYRLEKRDQATMQDVENKIQEVQSILVKQQQRAERQAKEERRQRELESLSLDDFEDDSLSLEIPVEESLLGEDSDLSLSGGSDMRLGQIVDDMSDPGSDVVALEWSDTDGGTESGLNLDDEAISLADPSLDDEFFDSDLVDGDS